MKGKTLFARNVGGEVAAGTIIKPSQGRCRVFKPKKDGEPGAMEETGPELAFFNINPHPVSEDAFILITGMGDEFYVTNTDLEGSEHKARARAKIEGRE